MYGIHPVPRPTDAHKGVEMEARAFSASGSFEGKA